MVRTLKTEGIVLKKKSLLNTDKLIIFLTPKYGKITTFAKGIKRITSRRLPHTQTANLVFLQAQRRNDRLYLGETTLLSGFSQIKKDEAKSNCLYLMFFILDRLIPAEQEDERLYRLVKYFLVTLSKNTGATGDFFTDYLNLILSYLGYTHEKKSFNELRFTIEELIHEKFPRISI
ncbi:DNA repair protein RecO [Candidatus Roizmanbacteria bacterium]|nr:DNA repair protein RecO [Candidatus Roizmanbacteria bacterium]